jgi:hypothetical protein
MRIVRKNNTTAKQPFMFLSTSFLPALCGAGPTDVVAERRDSPQTAVSVANPRSLSQTAAYRRNRTLLHESLREAPYCSDIFILLSKKGILGCYM